MKVISGWQYHPWMIISSSQDDLYPRMIFVLGWSSSQDHPRHPRMILIPEWSHHPGMKIILGPAAVIRGWHVVPGWWYHPGMFHLGCNGSSHLRFFASYFLDCCVGAHRDTGAAEIWRFLFHFIAFGLTMGLLQRKNYRKRESGK